MTKGALIITTDHHLTDTQTALLSKYADEAAKELGLTPIVLDGGMKAEVSHDLSGLIAAITAQTKAINHLAGSNMALVEAMTGPEGESGEQYLNG